MPDYADLLDFLAKNPPQIESERQLHASLLELMAQCLRSDALQGVEPPETGEQPLDDTLAESHVSWVRFS